MIANWNSVPAEILHLIFSHFNPEHKEGWNALFECVKTCRSWHPVAERSAYAFIHLGHLYGKKLLGSDETFTTRLLRWLHYIDFSSSVRWHHVKTIDIDKRTDFTTLESISTAFPFVETIKTTEGSNEFYDCLKKIRERSCWTKLKRFPHPTKREGVSSQFTTCSLAYKETLTHLTLFDDVPNCYSTNKIRLPESYSDLHAFRNLTHLTYFHAADSTIECFDKVFQDCKKLVSVKLETNKDARSLRQVTDLTRVQSSPNIKSLFIKTRIDSTQSLRYLMKKFSNLKYLSIEDPIESDFISDTMCTYSSSDLVDFIRFCQNVPKSVIKIKVFSSNIPQHLINLWNSTPPDDRSSSYTWFFDAFPAFQIGKNSLILEQGDGKIITLRYYSAHWRSCDKDLSDGSLSIQQLGFFSKQLFMKNT